MNSIVDYLNAAADHWTRWMLMATLDSAALLAIVGLVWLAIRRRVAPQVGYWLFLLVVLKLFIPVGVPVPAGVARLTPSAIVLPTESAGAQPPTDRIVPPAMAAQPAANVAGSFSPESAEPTNNGDAVAAVAATTVAANRAVSVADVTAPARLSWAAGIMLAWLSTVIALVTRALVIQARFRSALKRLAPLDAVWLGCDLGELRRRARVAARIRLVESDSIESPAVWGLFRPTIILPRGIVATLTVGQLRWVLLHELAHVRRFDLAGLIMERCAAVIYFFNPAVWIANRMVDRLREDACDDFAVALSGPSVEPADVFLHILRFAQILIGKFVKQGTYGTFATTDDLGRLRIVRPPEPRHFNVDITLPGCGPYCAKWSSETHSEQIPAQFTAELEAGWSVGGVVVDGDGKPVEGVQVQPSIEFKKRPGDVKQLRVGTNIKTDAAGKWRFNSVPASMPEVFVQISRADYLPLRRRLSRSEFAIEPGSGPTARLELSAGLAITGTITDDSGNPISGALIRTKFLNDEREARSAEDGSYRLIGCEPTMTRIVVWALGRALDMKEVRVAAGMAPVDSSPADMCASACSTNMAKVCPKAASSSNAGGVTSSTSSSTTSTSTPTWTAFGSGTRRRSTSSRPTSAGPTECNCKSSRFLPVTKSMSLGFLPRWSFPAA